MTMFDEAVKRFDIERRAAGDLLAGDRLRALRELETAAERLRTEGRTVLERELDRALAKNVEPQTAREMLTDPIVAFIATRGAMRAALDQRTEHSEAVAAEIADGEAGSARLLMIERELGTRGG